MGEESIIKEFLQPYKDYKSGPFPSGNVKAFKTAKYEMFWQNSKRISSFLNIETKKNTSGIKYFNVNIGATLLLL